MNLYNERFYSTVSADCFSSIECDSRNFYSPFSGSTTWHFDQSDLDLLSNLSSPCTTHTWSVRDPNLWVSL